MSAIIRCPICGSSIDRAGGFSPMSQHAQLQHANRCGFDGDYLCRKCGKRSSPRYLMHSKNCPFCRAPVVRPSNDDFAESEMVEPEEPKPVTPEFSESKKSEPEPSVDGKKRKAPKLRFEI